MTRIRIPLASVGALTLLAAALAGCTPEPEPTRTPTAAFASEEEAFAAAEETYRAYNDAGNARRAGQSTPDPQDFLTGRALEGDIDAVNTLERQGLRIGGSVSLVSFSGEEALLTETPEQVHALVCLDASGARVLDTDGNDVTPSDRASVLAQSVTMVNTDHGWRISVEAETEADQC